MLVMNIALDLRGGGGRRRQRGRRAELLGQIYRTFTSFERERFPGALPISTEYRRDRTGSDISVWWLKKLLSGVSSPSTQQHCDVPSLEWRRQIDCCRFLDILRRYLKIKGKRRRIDSIKWINGLRRWRADLIGRQISRQNKCIASCTFEESICSLFRPSASDISKT